MTECMDQNQSAQSQSSYDIVIVGAGLVGASLAVSVAQRCPHLSVAVVESSAALAEAHTEGFDPRVVALTHRSQNFLHGLGAWAAIEQQRYCPYRDMKVWDGEGNGSIHFDSRDQRTDHLGCIVENSIALAAIQQQLLALENIDLLQPLRVEHFSRVDADSEVEITLSNQQRVTTPLLIAADGANSTIRQQAGFAMREWDYGHKAIVTTVRCEQPHQFTAWQRFMATGPLAFLPLRNESNDDHYCSIVWSCEDDLAEELMALDDGEFCQRSGAAFEYRLGNIESVDKRYAIALRQRHAKRYCQANIALVGDAAHTIHPLAGQGVNLGLQDVMALSDEIYRAAERNIPLSDASVLRRYQRRRLSDNLMMMAAMEGFKRLFGSRNLALHWLRNEGVRQVNNLTLLKKLIVKHALK